MKTPRPHQIRAISMLRASVARGALRPILMIATGGGKTFVAAMLIRGGRERGKRILFIVDAISLVDQTVQAFYAAGLYDIGVIQGHHQMEDWSKPIQVASVQTLRRRGMPKADIVIVDECHRQDAWLHQIMASPEWANVPFIGLSATPWSKGLGNVYNDLIIPITMAELIEQGYLCPFRAFAVDRPDLTAVKTVAGDYHEGQLAEVMTDGALVANIVDTWRRRGEDRPTLAFCVDRAHAKKVQARFEEAGISWGYIDCHVDRDERRRIQGQLERGEIKGVANVGCLTTGVDWAIGCIILARPTKSEILYVQMVGRGLRVNEGIPDCIILDHADNTLRLGFVTDIEHTTLCTAKKGERTQQERQVPLPKECPSCAFLKPPKVRECPACGFAPEARSDIEEEDGELVEIKRARAKPTMAEKQSWYSQLLSISRERGYRSGWVAHTYQKRFGVFPRGLKTWVTERPSQEVRNFVLGMNIRYSKGPGRHAA